MPKIVEHNAYRQELLEKSLAVFAQRGYERVTMRFLAAELGISTGTLYHYFSGKEDIFEQLVTSFTHTSLEVLANMLQGMSGREKKLERFCLYVIDNEKLLADTFLLLLDYYRSQDTQNGQLVVRRALSEYWQKISELLDIPVATAQLFLASTDGLILQRLYSQDDIDLKQALNLLRLVLLNNLNTH